MSYMHIDNLYKDRDILMCREVYAMEKIHGTSAHVKFSADGSLTFFAGGVPHDQFVALFDQAELAKLFRENYLGMEMTVYGEAYGGKCQGMSKVYGTSLRFVVFDVKIGESWLNVPNAEQVAHRLGFDFVPYEKIEATMEQIDAQRDRPSVQAGKNGIIGDNLWREGVVLRPTVELTRNNGKRLICKHKRDTERETKTPREVSPEQLQVLSDAQAIADEWVTMTRLRHVLDSLGACDKDLSIMPRLISAMIEDIRREGEGEIVWSKPVSTAIGRKTAEMMKLYVRAQNSQMLVQYLTE